MADWRGQISLPHSSAGDPSIYTIIVASKPTLRARTIHDAPDTNTDTHTCAHMCSHAKSSARMCHMCEPTPHPCAHKRPRAYGIHAGTHACSLPRTHTHTTHTCTHSVAETIASQTSGKPGWKKWKAKRPDARAAARAERRMAKAKVQYGIACAALRDGTQSTWRPMSISTGRGFSFAEFTAELKIRRRFRFGVQRSLDPNFDIGDVATHPWACSCMIMRDWFAHQRFPM